MRSIVLSPVLVLEFRLLLSKLLISLVAEDRAGITYHTTNLTALAETQPFFFSILKVAASFWLVFIVLMMLIPTPDFLVFCCFYVRVEFWNSLAILLMPLPQENPKV